MTPQAVFAPRLLQGKVAFVAGGTRGINLGIARRFAMQGAHVVVASRDEGRCAAAAEELRANSQHMVSNALETATQASSVATASTEVSSNVEVVAAGAEEMQASIRDIAKTVMGVGDGEVIDEKLKAKSSLLGKFDLKGMLSKKPKGAEKAPATAKA